MSAPFIKFRSVSKSFGGVAALTDVTLSIPRGECHGLMGENGAGKSTLGKILAGIHRPETGGMDIDGQPQVFSSPRDALAAGVAMVHQELAFCPELSVAENLCMGRYPRKFGMLLDRANMHARAEELLAAIGVSLDVRLKMCDLSTAQEQLVQIAAAAGTNPRILIFDEPTSSLSDPEARRLFELIETLKSRGITMIYVSHRMPELFRLCDKISVLRDGRYVGELSGAGMTEAAVVRMMIGRDLEGYFPSHLDAAPGDVVLKVRDLSSPGLFSGVSFELRAGEILGFAGLVGAGRSEIAKAIFGLDPQARGHVELDGKNLPLGSIRASLDAGISLVPEDRKRQGCILGMPCSANISMAVLPELTKAGLLDRPREKQISEEYFGRLSIKAASPEAPVHSLSGGNQQKVVLAKWLAKGGRVLIVDEPTRGVDVGAKAAIHALIDQLAHQGLAVILISSELPELINLSSRVIVMREGRLVGEVSRAKLDQESVLRLMAGVSATGPDRESRDSLAKE
jgi:ABC-type sugar transport system ATPase subunit